MSQDSMPSNDLKFNQLLEYISRENRVCPNPQEWAKIFEMLPNKKRTIGGGFDPPAPLILAAWWGTPNMFKKERFLHHLRYALAQNVLDQVDQYLRKLRPEQWHTF